MLLSCFKSKVWIPKNVRQNEGCRGRKGVRVLKEEGCREKVPHGPPSFPE